MKKLLSVLFAVLIVVSFTVSSFATTADDTIVVTATVVGVATVTAGDAAFGDYLMTDPDRSIVVAILVTATNSLSYNLSVDATTQLTSLTTVDELTATTDFVNLTGQSGTGSAVGYTTNVTLAGDQSAAVGDYTGSLTVAVDY